MSSATVQGERPWAIALVTFFLLFAGILPSVACEETRRSLGEDCLKDDDCLSGVCSQLRCAAIPPTIDAALFADVAPGNALADAPSEAADGPNEPDSPDSQSSDDGLEAAQGSDGGDSAGDEGAEIVDGPPSSSTADASIDGDDSGS